MAVVAMVGVWPAEAATSITVDAPANDVVWSGATPTDFHVTGHANTSGGYNVAGVHVKVEPNDSGTHTYDPPTQIFNADKTAENFEILVFPDFNGKYKVSAFAIGRSCGLLGCTDQNSGTIVKSIVVAVAPKVPTGAKASLTDSKATFEWNANNTEGDLLGYFVERQAPGAASYTCLSAVKVNPDTPATYKITDDVKSLNSGDVRYRVRAARALNATTTMGTCAAPGESITSAASTSVKVAWVNPTATTTSTTTPGGGGGGTGGSTTSTTRPKSSTGTPAGSKTSNPSSSPNLSALGSLGSTNNLARPSNLRPNEIDPGFNELLPFESGTGPSGAADNSAASAQTPLNGADSGGGQTTTLLFIAAGLLATVLSMHVLWLKAQVDRTPLEPLAPQDIAVL